MPLRIFILFISLAFVPVSCFSVEEQKSRLFNNYTFYYGIDIGNLETSFKNRYGSDFFDEYHSDYNFFFGARKNKSLGFELGFSTTREIHNDVYLTSGNYLPGSSTPLPGFQSWHTTYKARNFYLGLNFLYYLTRNTSVYALASGEITYMDIRMELVNSYLPGQLINKVTRTFSKTQVIPSVKLGINYNITAGWGLRLYYAWRYYELFNPMKSKEFPNRSSELRLNNSNSLYFGTYFAF